MTQVQRFLLLGVMAAAWAGLAPAPPPPLVEATAAPVRSLVPAHDAHVAPTAPADTLRRRVAAGEPLIMTLPAARSGRPVTAYRLVRAPALCWLVDRSLLWRTRPADVGAHAVLVRADFGPDAPPDTLTILVDVTE